MEDEKLNKNGLIKVWLKIWTLLKLLVGDVDVTGKGDLQTQINNIDSRVEECFRNASDGKKLVADAITGKGVLTKVSDTFATMAANIAKIAGAAKLQNKTAVLSNVEQTIKADSEYDGLGQVSIPAVKGTAGAGDVLTGKTFSGAAGIEKAGTMPNKGAWTGDTADNGNVSIPAGYHNGKGYVSGAGAYAKGMADADARTNTSSANYKNGYSAGVTATKKGTAAAGDVLTGKTFTNASSVGAAGTMANKGATTVDAGAVSQDDTYTYLTVPAAGFYNANSKLRTKNSNLNNAIYNAIVAQGVTPASKNYADLATAIAAVKANNYNSGYNSGVATGINSMAIHAVGGANTGTFTITNYAYCAKAFLIVEVVDDDRRSFASVTVPGGTCTQIHNLEYGQHDCFTNMQVFEITGLPAGTITISCSLGYGRCAVLIGA